MSDALVARVDARGLTWNCWRAAMGHWCITIDDGKGLRLEHSDISLEAVLTWAAEVVFLPVVPVRPRLVNFEVRRTSDSTSRWHVYEDGHLCLRFSTKTKADAWVEAAIKRRRDEIDDWNTEWSMLVDCGGQPEVDFRWAS